MAIGKNVRLHALVRSDNANDVAEKRVRVHAPKVGGVGLRLVYVCNWSGVQDFAVIGTNTRRGLCGRMASGGQAG